MFSAFNSDLLLSFGIPTPHAQAFTYVGFGAADDDNVATITYTNDIGTILGVLTFTYVGLTNNILTITRTA